jgi:hypothetical protein
MVFPRTSLVKGLMSSECTVHPPGFSMRNMSWQAVLIFSGGMCSRTEIENTMSKWLSGSSRQKFPSSVLTKRVCGRLCWVLANCSAEKKSLSSAAPIVEPCPEVLIEESAGTHADSQNPLGVQRVDFVCAEQSPHFLQSPAMLLRKDILGIAFAKFDKLLAGSKLEHMHQFTPCTAVASRKRVVLGQVKT